MTAEDAEAIETSLAEVEAQIVVLERQGGTYVTEYLGHLLRKEMRPRTPVGMHSKVAAALRDIAIDEATAQRIFGRRRHG